MYFVSAQHLYLFCLLCFVFLSPSLQEIQKSADIIVQDPLAEGKAGGKEGEGGGERGYEAAQQ